MVTDLEGNSRFSMKINSEKNIQKKGMSAFSGRIVGVK